MIAFDDETGDGRPLLEQVVTGGVRVTPRRPLADVRARAQELIGELPESLRQLDAAPAYPVEPSDRLDRARRAHGGVRLESDP